MPPMESAALLLQPTSQPANDCGRRRGRAIGTGPLLGSRRDLRSCGPAAILSFIAAAFINWSAQVGAAHYCLRLVAQWEHPMENFPALFNSPASRPAQAFMIA